jgi:hypothetical protein
MDTGPVLGLSPLRPTFLDDLSSAESGESQAGPGAHIVTPVHRSGQRVTPVFDLDDDLDDDLDEDEEEDEEDGQKDEEEEDEEEEDEDEGDEDEPETWQVVPLTSLREPA